MIMLYGKSYAANDDELAHEAFGAKFNGTYRHTPQGIYLSDRDGCERAFIRHDGLGPVTVTTLSCGDRYYMHAITTIDGDWLGVPTSYMEEVKGARNLAKRMCRETAFSQVVD